MGREFVNDWRVAEFLEPVQVCSERATLKGLREALEKGHPVAVKRKGRWSVLLPQSAVGYPETRRLSDLPLKQAVLLTPDCSVSEALDKLTTSDIPYGLVLKDEQVEGAVSLNRLMRVACERAEKVADLGATLSDVVRQARVLVWRVPRISLSLKGLSMPPELEIYGAVEEILGYSAGDFLRDPGLWLKCIHPEDQPRVMEGASLLWEGKESVVLEHRFRHRDGHWVWIREQIFAERNSHGLISLHGIAIDVTEEAKKQEAERLKHRLYPALLRRAPGEALEAALKVLSGVLPIDAGVIWRLRPSGNVEATIQWTSPEYKERLGDLNEEFRRLCSPADGKAQRPQPTEASSTFKMAIKKKQAVYVPDLEQSESRGAQLCVRYSLRSFLLVPLLAERGESILLGLLSSQVNAFDEASRLLLDELQPVFAAVVKAWRYEEELKELNAGLERQVEQRTYELKVLYDLTKQLGFTLNYDELFRVVVEGLHRVVQYDVAATLLVVDNIKELLVYPARTLSPRLEEKVQRDLIAAFRALGGDLPGKGIPAKVLKPSSETSPPVKGLRSSFQVPLIVEPEGKLIGLLYVGAERENAFKEEQVRLLNTVSSQASLSIQRLRTLLAEQRQQMKTMLDTIPEGVLLLDAERRVVLTNPVGREYLALLGGVGQGESVKQLGEAKIEELLQSACGPLCAQLAGPEGRIFEVTSAPVEVGPEAGGWVLLLREVTEERRRGEELQAQARLAALGQLAAGIAHDFNNILTPIIGFAQLLKSRGDLPRDAYEMLKIISSQGERAAELVRKIMDFGRRSLIQKRPVELHSFLQGMVELLRRTIPENISILLTTMPGTYVVEADPASLQQIVTNLAVNARDAMPEGGEFRISLSRKHIEAPHLPGMSPGEWIELRFSDTGTGIAPEHLPHIFEPFFTTKKRGAGVGLGLSQVHGLVSQHGGFVSVESQPGKGTTIIVYLPPAVVEQPEEQIVEEPAPRGKGERVLVVEDDPQVLKLVALTLEDLGYIPVTASSGEEALEAFEKLEGNVDLLLTDLVMPKMGGRQLIQRLREKSPELKVLIMTGYPLGEDDVLFQRKLAEGWLSKPIRKEVLGRKLAEILPPK